MMSMKHSFSLKFRWVWLAQMVGLVGLYLAFELLGSVVSVTQGKVPAAWPAAGLAFAAVFLGGYRIAPAIGLGTWIFLRLKGAPGLASVGAALANMLEPMLAVYLIRPGIGGPRLFDR